MNIWTNYRGEDYLKNMKQINSEFEKVVTSFNTLKFLQQIYEQFADFLTRGPKLSLDACFLEYWKLTYSHAICVGIRRIFKKTGNSVSLEKLTEDVKKLGIKEIERGLSDIEPKVKKIKRFVDQKIAHLDPKPTSEQLTMPEIPEALDAIEDFLKIFSDKVLGKPMNHFHPSLDHDWLNVFKHLGDHYSKK